MPNGLLKALCATLVTASIVGLPPSSAPAQDSGGQDRAAIEEIVRAYIMENPEIVREALTEADRRSAAEALAKAHGLLRSAPISTAVGPDEPKVTMLEFFDYNCPYCRTVVDRIASSLEANPDLAVRFVELPILSPQSIEAARIALAAAKQDRYFDYHVALMQQIGRIDGTAAMEVAASIGLDMDRLASDLRGRDIDETLRLGREAAERLSISGTPAFVIGDAVIPGAIGEEGLMQLIDEAREGR